MNTKRLRFTISMLILLISVTKYARVIESFVDVINGGDVCSIGY